MNWYRSEKDNGQWTRLGWHEQAPEGSIVVETGSIPIDVMGYEVSVGDRVAVAMTVGRSANMRVGKVVAILPIMTDDYPAPDFKPVKIATNKVRVKCEWEDSSWDRSVKESSFAAELPKYIRL